MFITYRVYRATSSGGSKTALGSWQSSTTYNDYSASAGPTYYYWVKAKNSYGESAYSSYNTGYRKSCTYSISPTSKSFDSGGGSGTVSVTTQSGCPWTAVSNKSWITITSGGSGSGNGTVNYSVAANTGSPRTGTMTIAGKTFTVSQSEPCYSLSTNVSPSGGGSVSKSPNKACYYNEEVTLTASPKTGYEFDHWGGDLSGSTNPATVTMNSSKAVTAYFKSCAYSISPTSKSFDSGGGSGTVSVTTQSGCPWTAVSKNSWITITSGSSGSSNGTVHYSVAANTGTSRTGTITIAGKNFTVSQDGIGIPPTADAGPDQMVDERETVVLDGSNSSDPDDGITSYQWAQTAGPSVTLSNPEAVQPTFTAPNIGTEGATLTFQLMVSDNGGLQDTDTIIINVSNKIIAGDVDDSGTVDLSDIILALQVLAGMEPSEVVHKEADVNCDGKIGMEELIYILQTVSAQIENTLTVNKTGSGTITSSPPGIDCGNDCSESYEDGTVVTLTATADNGWGIANWSYEPTCMSQDCIMEQQICELDLLRQMSIGSRETLSCQATMNQAKTVTVTFEQGGQLNVRKTGSGTVTSSPSGICCEPDCQEFYSFSDSAATVTLIAEPAIGATFLGWGGTCSGTGDCVLSMNQVQNVTATFTEGGQYILNVNKTGSGTITSSPAGIDCGSDCSAEFEDGTAATLTITADTDWEITGFNIEGCGGESLTDEGMCELDFLRRLRATLPIVTTFSCTIFVDEPKTVAVTFEPQ